MSNNQRQQKKQSRTGLVLLLIVFIILFLLTTAILGSRLYDMATKDQYVVDMGTEELEGEIELFRVEYHNEQGEITVRGINADNVVAPGTSVSYDIRLRNNEDRVIDFVMIPQVEFLSGEEVPIEFKIKDDYGNYLLGDENTWGKPDDMNSLYHKGSIYPGEVFTYHVVWQWVYEVSDEQDAYDTYLGSQDGEILPGVRVGISTEAALNTYVETKDITHITHLRVRSTGCCWCCWLVWVFVVACLLLVLWVMRLTQKISKHQEELARYEQILTAQGLMVGGKLVNKTDAQ